MEEERREQLSGVAFAAGAYTLWGFLPLYWKLIGHVPSDQVLAHRIIWSFVFMILMLVVLGKLKSVWADLRALMTDRKKFINILLASIVISGNWFIYIWAVNNDHVIDASLGYYINPLISVLLGIVFLKERLSFWQIISFLLALTGVLIQTFQFGAIPWTALALAMSFGLYGLFKKMVNLGSLSGLTIETLLVSPVALIYLLSIGSTGSSVFFSTPSTAALLFGSGVATAVPLLLFASGARRIPLFMIGFLQYIAPTIMLILGVFLYKETFTQVHFVSFFFIWMALTIFSLSRTKLLTSVETKLFKKKTA